MRKRTTTAPTADPRGDLVVCLLAGHAYEGREGYTAPTGGLPAGWNYIRFSDGYVGIFRPEDIATAALGAGE